MEKGAIIKHDPKKAPKTGDWKFMEPVVDKKKCVGCGTCVSYCPEAAIILKISKTKPRGIADIDQDVCKGCGVCATVCSVKAIMMKKYGK